MPSPVAVFATGDAREAELAAKLRVPLLTNRADLSGSYLLFHAGKLALADARHPEFKEFAIDFADARSLARLKEPLAQDPLRKAFGKKIKDMVVWDMTLGFGRDTFDLARMGAKVYAWERSPIVFALWEDARERALANPALAKLFAQIHAELGEGKDSLNAETDSRFPPPDFIYLDPMYPEAPGASAKRKKEMVLLRELVGDDLDARGLFASAKDAGAVRVVVKHPLRAPAFAEPALAVRGKSHRFDVYIRGVNY